MKSLVGGGLLVVLALFMLVGFVRSAAPLSAFATVVALAITVALPGIAGLALITRHLAFATKEHLCSRKPTARHGLRGLHGKGTDTAF